MDNYNKVKDFLNGNREYFSDIEIEELIAFAVQQDGWENNKGYKHERVEHNPLEKAFFEQWLEENKPLAHINNGQGILQDLFIERTGMIGQRKWIADINNRDRWIVATVIQWLGTNVGMGFLRETFARVNMTIVEKS